MEREIIEVANFPEKKKKRNSEDKDQEENTISEIRDNVFKNRSYSCHLSLSFQQTEKARNSFVATRQSGRLQREKLWRVLIKANLD